MLRGRPPTTDHSPTLSGSQGDRRLEEPGSGKEEAGSAKSQDPQEPQYPTSQPLPSSHADASTMGHLHPPHHVLTIRTVSTTKGEARCRVRAMEGQGRALKTRQGMGRDVGPGARGQHSGREGGRSPKQGLPQGGTWDEFPLAGIPLAGYPHGKGRELQNLPPLLPQALEATPQCPPTGTGRHLGSPA